MNVQELRKALPIDKTDLDMELCMQSARACQAAEYALDAEAKYLAEQIAFEEFLGGKDEEIRNGWTGKKPPTVAEMEAAMNQDKSVVAYKHKMLKLEVNKKLLGILREGWRSRKDMLVQKAIDVRSEREHLNSDFMRGQEAA